MQTLTARAKAVRLRFALLVERLVGQPQHLEHVYPYAELFPWNMTRDSPLSNKQALALDYTNSLCSLLHLPKML
jgi:hypothetical protein